MPLLTRFVERLALIVLMIGGVGMLASMLLGVADIVGTQVLLVPVPGPRELTESTMVLIVFGALAYAQIRRQHIRVELVYFQMGPRVRAGMDVVTDLCAILFFALILSQAVAEAQYSLQIGEATSGLIRFPLWPARFTLAAGCALMILQLCLHVVEDFGRIRTGAPPLGDTSGLYGLETPETTRGQKPGDDG
ncbi:MAG: TRAP transporter small permease [Pseudomonadota bacterium]